MAFELPDRFDPGEAAQRIYQFWERGGWFHSEPDAAKEPYSIVIPPPNVTGALHLGHALNNTLQDVQIRMRRMQGYNALWMPGTDHAGIATQAVVEKRLKEEEGKTRHDLGREKLVERIWAWKDQYEARILDQLKRMGCSCDWQRTRFTLDEVCARAVRHTFFDLFQKQLIYRGKRLVNWDTFLQTAVSDDEVFQEKVKGSFWHFNYPVIDPQAGEPEFVTIATTRPETMLGDTAVAVHPDPAAAFAKLESETAAKLEKASERERGEVQAQLDNIRERRKIMAPQLEQLRDMALAGRKLLLPLLNREIPLVADPWAKPELGSGCVKITPAHDPNDYEVGRRCGLPMINVLNPDGTLNANAGPYQGLTISKARKQIVADLEEQQLLLEIEAKEIDLPHSDRSKTPIEPYLADQWFVRMNELSQSAIDAVQDGRVKILPVRYTRGYVDWLAEKRDWPVSRQLWWGHRIPVWSKVCADPAETEAALEALQAEPAVEEGRVALQVERTEQRDSSLPAESQVELPHAYVHLCIADGDEALEAKFAQWGFVQEEDVLDTWFSSALWPHSTLGWPDRSPELDYYYPTSALITSRDIITLWVARMVISGLNNMGEIPFREVFIHPKILDGDGETMSKSKGNGIDPIDVIEKFGPDALRFAMAHLTTETQDVRMPVQFECPHCAALIKQTRKNRELPRIACPKCGEPFSTQWAKSVEDTALPRGAVVSERFELARNFCNKIWNAARFALMRMEDFPTQMVADEQLAVEDRWLLSRLATVTEQVTEALEGYRFADATRCLYDFAWDEFCSFYIEMAKERLQEDASRPTAQAVLAHVLDRLLRLLHPFMPFITEEIWQLLNKVVPRRGLRELETGCESLICAAWPKVDEQWRDGEIEARFATFQTVLGALREIRSRQNIPPREAITFAVRCDASVVGLLEPMAGHFNALAGATASAWGADAEPPATNATVNIGGMDIYVDLERFIDVAAEIARLEKIDANLQKQIRGKEAKLGNASFVERAPAKVVEGERRSLEQLKEQMAATTESLAGLRARDT